MYKNVIIGVLVLMVLAEGGYILKLRSDRSSLAAMIKPASSDSPRPQPQTLSAGMKISDSPISQIAYKVAPGALDDNAKSALTGWNITQITNKDGSMTVTLSPKNADDQKHVYTVKKGNSLYFVEMTKSDDKSDTDSDANLRDDYGILVDANGIVQ